MTTASYSQPYIKPELVQYLNENNDELNLHAECFLDDLNLRENRTISRDDLVTHVPALATRMGMHSPSEQEIHDALDSFKSQKDDQQGDGQLGTDEFPEYVRHLHTRSLHRASSESCLPQMNPHDPASSDVPFVGLINPGSGNKMGGVILAEADRQLSYKMRLLHIIRVCTNEDNMFYIFRNSLDKAKEEAKAKMIRQPGTDFRPRLICGGGDGTATFALSIVFKALMHPGLGFTGFRWSEAEMTQFFPALVQLPLGTGNDLAGILGWGRTFDPATKPASSREWFQKALSVRTPTRDFDVWALFPRGAPVKVCALESIQKTSRVQQVLGSLHLSTKAAGSYPTFKEAGPAVPFLSLLYATMGSLGLITALVEIHRTESQFMNKVRYVVDGASAFIGRSSANVDLEGVEVIDNEDDVIFPPEGQDGSVFESIGFMNVNSFIGGNIATSKPANFSDGKADWFLYKKGNLTYQAAQGKFGKLKSKKVSQAVIEVSGEMPFEFMQVDGEARVLFQPQCEDWQLEVRQGMVIPVVVNPDQEGPPATSGCARGLKFTGSEPEAAEFKQRLFRFCHNELASEMNATSDEIDDLHEHELVRPPTPRGICEAESSEGSSEYDDSDGATPVVEGVTRSASSGWWCGPNRSQS